MWFFKKKTKTGMVITPSKDPIHPRREHEYVDWYSYSNPQIANVADHLDKIQKEDHRSFLWGRTTIVQYCKFCNDVRWFHIAGTSIPPAKTP
jgi:hypothetical protein